ncbi:MAG TPA: putative metal-binding motif-containing protein [Kofleriaceae bacterium]|nr:putative metal-binding motif-containing protein [Kofleriaceae bacterium]
MNRFPYVLRPTLALFALVTLAGGGLATLGLATLGGCGTETGILIEVTTADDLAEVDLSVLEIYVGTRDSDGQFVRQLDMGDRIDVSGRDLASDPYELMLRPQEGGLEGPIMVAAAARDSTSDNDRILAFGGLPEPATFASGEVRHWTIVLARVPADGGLPVTDTGCAHWEGGHIGVPEDPDCDGYTTADEGDACASDPDRHPGAEETCDGIDNNCDGRCDDIDADGDGVTGCASECATITAIDCDDTDSTVYPGAEELCDGIDQDCSSGGGAAPLCVLTQQGFCVQGEQACGPERLCSALVPRMEVNDKSMCDPAQITCDLVVLGRKEEIDVQCEPGIEPLAPRAMGATVCEWTIVSNGGFAVNFLVDGVALPTASVCDPLLQVASIPASPGTGEVILRRITEADVRSFVFQVHSENTDLSCPDSADDRLKCGP